MLQVYRVIQAALIAFLFLLSAGVEQAVAAPAPAPNTFECILPYISGGGMVSLINASGADQDIEITVMNAYTYKITVQKYSSYTFQSPVYQYFFVPVVDGGPISFKSDQPIVAYTVLAEDSVTIQCSDPNKKMKMFVGGARTGIAIVNSKTSPIRVQIFQDAERTPILNLTIAGVERRMGFLGDAIPVSGMHTYMAVADGEGIGLAAISYERNPAVPVPVAEGATPPAVDLSAAPPTTSFGVSK